MSETGNAEQPEGICRNCGTEVRPGDAFCASCGERRASKATNPDGAEAFSTPQRFDTATARSPANQRNLKLLLYVVVASVSLLVAYLILSYSVVLGFMLIGAAAFAAFTIRRSRSSQSDFERQTFEQAERCGEAAQRALGEARDRYRTWSEARAAERERRRLREEFERYARFFRRAQEGSEHYLEWWRQYGGPDGGRGLFSVPELLDGALARSYSGRAALEGMQDRFEGLLRERRFEVAQVGLDRVRASQEQHVDGTDEKEELPLEPVLAPLNLVVVELREVPGWSRYKEEFLAFALDLTKKLDSPVINAAIEAERRRLERFPDPHKIPEPEPKKAGARQQDWVALGLTFLLINQMNQSR